MKAYIKVVYSSEGMSPAQVEGIFNDHGFHKMNGQQAFETEAVDLADFAVKLSTLHPALKGTGIRYMITGGKTFDVSAIPSCHERLENWRDTGIDVDELADLLETDLASFRRRALEMTTIQFERIAAEKEKELHEKQVKEKVESIKKRAADLLTSKDGHTFIELVKASGMEEEELKQLLLDLVDKGKIKAEQRGRHVVYVAL
jgi:DNA-binding transcriptional MerR regulator